jgi:hypothetical protein
MKYVMFTHIKTGLKLPVFFADQFTHSEVQVEKGWVPTSAGHFSIMKFTTSGTSSSLKLQPVTDDAEVCKLVLAGMESMIYLAQDTEANLVHLRNIRKQRRQKAKVTV